MKVIGTERIPIKAWLDEIEDGALEQARNLANLPFAFRHIALMPDAHQGFGMPIGGVMATKGAIVPNAVGVDIGCGVCAAKTNLTGIDTGTLKKIVAEIRETIPVGFKHQARPKEWDGFAVAPDVEVIQRQLESAHFQLGTLGGGNHFIEIQMGSDGFVWAMIHSGSRNLGKQVADKYHKIAVELCTGWYSGIPNKDLAFLPTDSREGREYYQAMKFCLQFAAENRAQMMMQVMRIFTVYTGCWQIDEINIHHNYAAMENHFGQNVMVHRKGATRAKAGEMGLIPGSMGTKSYITEGLGNPESFTSCSHGAGRRMGRKQAQRELNLEEEQAKMAGIVHGLNTVEDLEEAPSAYKDIDTVMYNQSDLVKILVELRPLAVVKG